MRLPARLFPALSAVVACLAALAAPAGRANTGAVPDYAFRPVPSVPLDAAELARPVPKFVYMFGQPARWTSTFAWKYNPDGAPGAFADPAVAVASLQASLDRWSAVCNVRTRYDGITAARPNQTIQSPAYGEQPDNQNVVGWQALDDNTSGLTYSWFVSAGSTRSIVDSDVMLSPRWLTSALAFDRTATHEWGHALGLAHSNVTNAIMAGPPDTAYNGMATLGPDDMRGCRCLYGPAPGQSAGYACSLPHSADFGAVAVGDAGTAVVTFRNDGNAPLSIYLATPSAQEFDRAAGCDPGTSLAPGASCAMTLRVRPSSPGTHKGTLSVSTSDGEYRLPMVADAVAAGASNFTGLWWNAPAGSENGWGLNIAHQGDTLFVTWFTYDGGGAAWWLSMIATLGPDGRYRGDLLVTRGPPFSSSPFNPGGTPLPATNVGSGVLDVTTPSSPVFSYTVNGVSQTKTLTRQSLNAAPLPACTFGGFADLSLATNYTDLWWAAQGSEPGWGVNLTHQGDTVFATWFTYGADGAPLWLAATANRIAQGIYEGTLYRTSGPAFGSAPWDSSRFVPTAVGSARFTFTNGNAGTFRYTVDGIQQSKSINRQVLVAPGTSCR